MATTVQINAVIDIILSVFGNDAEAFKTALEEIKANTEKVTIDNKIADLRKQQREANEAIEAQIQVLLGMK
jgi:small-conductance mechanosensitive channel